MNAGLLIWYNVLDQACANELVEPLLYKLFHTCLKAVRMNQNN